MGAKKKKKRKRNLQLFPRSGVPLHICTQAQLLCLILRLNVSKLHIVISLYIHGLFFLFVCWILCLDFNDDRVQWRMAPSDRSVGKRRKDLRNKSAFFEQLDRLDHLSDSDSNASTSCALIPKKGGDPLAASPSKDSSRSSTPDPLLVSKVSLQQGVSSTASNKDSTAYIKEPRSQRHSQNTCRRPKRVRPPDRRTVAAEGRQQLFKGLVFCSYTYLICYTPAVFELC